MKRKILRKVERNMRTKDTKKLLRLNETKLHIFVTSLYCFNEFQQRNKNNIFYTMWMAKKIP